MYKPKSEESSITKFEKTITDGRVLVNGKTYIEMDPDERAFFALSVNIQKNKAEVEKRAARRSLRQLSQFVQF